MKWRVLDRRGARYARLAGLAVAGLGLFIAAAFLLLPLAGRAAIRGLEWLVEGCVWLANSIVAGASLWDVTRTIGWAAVGSVVSPRGSLVLAVLVAIGIVALYLLQRLLESEEERPQ